MHLVDSSNHEHVHDVVRVEDKIYFAREPFLRNIDSANVSPKDGQDVLHDDVVGGVWSPSSPGTKSEQKAEDPYAEGGGESETPAPDGRDCHGLVQAHYTNE